MALEDVVPTEEVEKVNVVLDKVLQQIHFIDHMTIATGDINWRFGDGESPGDITPKSNRHLHYVPDTNSGIIQDVHSKVYTRFPGSNKKDGLQSLQLCIKGKSGSWLNFESAPARWTESTKNELLRNQGSITFTCHHRRRRNNCIPLEDPAWWPADPITSKILFPWGILYNRARKLNARTSDTARSSLQKSSRHLAAMVVTVTAVIHAALETASIGSVRHRQPVDANAKSTGLHWIPVVVGSKLVSTGIHNRRLFPSLHGSTGCVGQFPLLSTEFTVEKHNCAYLCQDNTIWPSNPINSEVLSNIRRNPLSYRAPTPPLIHWQLLDPRSLVAGSTASRTPAQIITMLPPALSVQEIWDYIISFKHRTADLKSLALSSRCKHLQAILPHSPHLGRYIQSITASVEIDPFVLQQLHVMALPRLKKLTIHSINIFVVSLPMNEVLRDLVSLPSLSEFRIASGDSAPRFRNTMTAFTYMVFDFAPIEEVDLAPSEPGTYQRRVKRLTINAYNPVTIMWLVHPDCPFDFHHLVEVDLTPEPANEDLQRLVVSARLTIREFGFTPPLRPETHTFDLTQFPHLTALRICSKSLSHFIQSVVSYLARAPQHSGIQSLLLEFYTFRATHAEEMDWDNADSVRLKGEGLRA
ncbi:hypothetical protein DFH06DRAFT_1130053 [Mycena polygramma]|nr:hypothetical protein DFH06DRAFT_1130053 [Mycena polygramma]